MKRKIVSIFVSMLLCVTVLSVTGTEIVEEYEMPSCKLAPRTSNCDMQDLRYNVEDLSGKGITCYAVDCNTNNFVWFDPADPGTFHDIGPFPSTQFPQGGTFVEDVWWVCDTKGSIWTVDEETGDTTYIGNAGTGELVALAYDETSGTLYGGSSQDLYEIDQTTGEATRIGPFNQLGEWMISLDVDVNGTMYGYDLNGDNSNLYSVNKTTGRATVIGNTGVSMMYGQDMAYDLDNEIMYACVFNFGSFCGELRSVNLETGKFTFIAILCDYHQTTCFAIHTSLPPDTPSTPSGPTEGVVGVKYTFSTSTTDPEGEQVSYLWDWGDGTSTKWTDFCNSGVTVWASHIWTELDTYEITVKAKDIHKGESNWSDPLTLHIIVRPILEIGNITGKLFKVITVIRNTGGVDATKVNWSITLDGGFILLGKETTGSIPSIPVGDETKISSILIFGFGKTVITATAECAEGSSDTNTKDAFVLLFFIL